MVLLVAVLAYPAGGSSQLASLLATPMWRVPAFLRGLQAWGLCRAMPEKEVIQMSLPYVPCQVAAP